jgi:hypothetical protein
MTQKIRKTRGFVSDSIYSISVMITNFVEDENICIVDVKIFEASRGNGEVKALLIYEEQ